MPMCRDHWFRRGDVEVKTTAGAADEDQYYVLIYMLYCNDPQKPRLPGGVFLSTELRQGATWTVPESYRCEFQLVTSGDGAIDTEISLNDRPVSCSEGRHCQGNCQAEVAGLAGFWSVTGVTIPS